MPENKRNIYHITINPIDFERRIQNQAESAQQAGYQVNVIALAKPAQRSQNNPFCFALIRLKTPFYQGGLLKFLHFNWKIFWSLLFRQIDILHCHDLWVMPAAWMLKIVKNNRLIYDAHEFYAGLEIFNRHKIRKKIWMALEYLAIPSVDVLLTVSEPLAGLYRQKYKRLTEVKVIRNMPKLESRKNKNPVVKFPLTSHPVIIYQGHFRPGRGLVNLIHAIPLTDNTHLMLVGGGELESELRKLVEYYHLTDRVTFLGYVPTADLISISAQADLGVVLFEPTSLNYAYALPNKFFEYVMAGIPVLASAIDTFKAYIAQYDLGLTVNPSNSQAIAAGIRTMLSDPEKMSVWRKNAEQAAKILNWNHESVKMNAIYERI